MPAVTSRRNPLVERFRAAARRETADALLLDGVHLVAEALHANVHVREAAISLDARDRPDVLAVLARLSHVHVPITDASPSVMSAISPVRSPSPIVAIADPPTVDARHLYRGDALVVMAADVQDPGNLGAIVRVAEAGGAAGVVCMGTCADPFGWKALRGSMGSALRLPILVHRDGELAIDEARRHGIRLVAAAPHGGPSLFDVDLTGRVAVLVGGEGQGLPSSYLHAADERVMIPMQAPVDSLNVAVAAALIVYEAGRQRTNQAR